MPIAAASGSKARGMMKQPTLARPSLCDCLSSAPTMKAAERERLDWTIVVITILVLGFLLVLIAGQLALRFSPRWELNTYMDSRIDPNSAYLTRRPSGFIEPIDAAILT